MHCSKQNEIIFQNIDQKLIERGSVTALSLSDPVNKASALFEWSP